MLSKSTLERDAELGLLKGMSEKRRLTLCYYLKYFQLHAQFPGSLDFVSPQVLKFLASFRRERIAFINAR